MILNKKKQIHSWFGKGRRKEKDINEKRAANSGKKYANSNLLLLASDWLIAWKKSFLLEGGASSSAIRLASCLVRFWLFFFFTNGAKCARLSAFGRMRELTGGKNFFCLFVKIWPLFKRKNFSLLEFFDAEKGKRFSFFFFLFRCAWWKSRLYSLFSFLNFRKL